MSCYLNNTYDMIYLHIFCNEWFAFIQVGDDYSVSFMIYSPFCNNSRLKSDQNLKMHKISMPFSFKQSICFIYFFVQRLGI